MSNSDSVPLDELPWISQEELFITMGDFDKECVDDTEVNAHVVVQEKAEDLSVKKKLRHKKTKLQQNKARARDPEFLSPQNHKPFTFHSTPLEKLMHRKDPVPVPVPVRVPSTTDNTSLSNEIDLLTYLEEQSTKSLATLPEKKKSSDIAPSNVTRTIIYRLFKCANCTSLFTRHAFKDHICDYNRMGKRITQKRSSKQNKNENGKNKLSNIYPEMPPIVNRLMYGKHKRFNHFFKDDQKCNDNETDIGNELNEKNIDDIPSISNGGSVHEEDDAPKDKKRCHQCKQCERKFVHASGLLRHMERHATVESSSVADTNMESDFVTSTDIVKIINELRVVIKCILCGRVFYEPNSALNHIDDHFERESDSDMDDATKFEQGEKQSRMVDLKDNKVDEKAQCLEILILGKLLQCEFCDFLFSDAANLFIHSACHNPDHRYECFTCCISICTIDQLTAHWQNECEFIRNNMKMYRTSITQHYFICNVCENKFDTIESILEHRYMTCHYFPRLCRFTQRLRMPCEYCDGIFETARDYVIHCDKYHRKRFYKRNGSSTSRVTLAAKLKPGIRRIATKGAAGSGGGGGGGEGEGEGEGGGEGGWSDPIDMTKHRQYLCDVCGKSYTQSSHLWQHLRFHQGIKPFACSEPGCNRKFTIRPDLNDHIRKCHTGERPFLCLVCGKRFLTGSVFYQHRLIHRGERRYQCDVCGKRFYRADALKNHQRIHTGEKPFGCMFCTKHFRQRGDRDKHIRARHSQLDENTQLMMQMHKLQLEAQAAAKLAAEHQMQYEQIQQTQKLLNQVAMMSNPDHFIHPLSDQAAAMLSLADLIEINTDGTSATSSNHSN